MKLLNIDRNYWIGTNSVHRHWIESQSVKLMNGLEYLYKITGLRPSQYPNTEMSPNQ